MNQGKLLPWERLVGLLSLCGMALLCAGVIRNLLKFGRAAATLSGLSHEGPLILLVGIPSVWIAHLWLVAVAIVSFRRRDRWRGSEVALVVVTLAFALIVDAAL